MNRTGGNIERIEIASGYAKMIIFNDTLQKQLVVKLNGFIGMMNLLIWDGLIINCIEVNRMQDDGTASFIQMLYSTCDKNVNYGERWLNKEIFEV